MHSPPLPLLGGLGPLPSTAPRTAPAAAPRTLSSQHLLGDTNEVLIEHHGAVYRLRQTSLGKLILTK